MQTLSPHIAPASLNQDIYTDLRGLSRLRKDAQENPEQTLKTVAQQFEALFMQMVLKSMRDASFGDPIFDSSQAEFYQDMFDKQLTLSLSQGRGMGMAEALERQMRGQLPMAADQIPQTKISTTGAMALLDKHVASDEESEQRELTMPVFKTIAVVSQQQDIKPAIKDELPQRFSSPEDFVRHMLPLAQNAANKLGVKAEVLLAQAALETGWGKHISQHVDGSSSYNLFNIKAGSDWDGDRVAIRTLEYRNGLARHERAAFRAYDSYADSFDDYVSFLQSRPRYQQALEQVDKPENFIRELHDAGYATDPNYSDKIINIMQRPMLQAAIDSEISKAS